MLVLYSKSRRNAIAKNAFSTHFIKTVILPYFVFGTARLFGKMTVSAKNPDKKPFPGAEPPRSRAAQKISDAPSARAGIRRRGMNANIKEALKKWKNC